MEWEDGAFSRYLLPRLGDRPVGEIGKADVLRMMEQVYSDHGASSSNHAHTALSLLLTFAVERDLIPANPAREVKKLHTAKPRERVLSHEEVRVFWRETGATEEEGAVGMTIQIGAALRFCLLTGQRKTEVAEMVWGEVDLDNALWTIPGALTKNGKTHSVPLSATSVGILRDALDSRGTKGGGRSAFVFTGKDPSQPMDGRAMGRACRRMAKRHGWESFGPHDLRRTMTTELATMGQPFDVLERLLNHTQPGGAALRSYNHASYEEPKRFAALSWADELLRIATGRAPRDNVLPITERIGDGAERIEGRLECG